MTRHEIENKVRLITGKFVDGGNYENIAMDEPLGSNGIGLDPIRLLELTIAIEREFAVELPEDIWMDKRLVTVRHLSDLIKRRLIRSYQPEEIYSPAATATAAVGDDTVSTGLVSISNIWDVIERLLGYRRQEIMMFDLMARTPVSADSRDIFVREIRPDDFDDFASFSANKRRIDSLEHFRERIATGLTGISAWRDGTLAGYMWIFRNGLTDNLSGMKIQIPDSTCFAFDITERASGIGQGVARAMIAYSLGLARTRGFRAHYLMLDSRNRALVNEATDLFGFRKLGELRTMEIFGRVFSSWKLEKNRGRNCEITL